MKKTALVLLGLALAAFLAYRFLFGGWTTSWNQQLTITIETPAGEVSGSAVTAVSVVDYSGPLMPWEARGPRATIRGEAVAVEVLPGKWLFALLEGGENPNGSAKVWAEVAYPIPLYTGGKLYGYWDRVADMKRQPYETPVPLPPEAWPLMVTFDDITDPASVARVGPNDLAASFGPGVRLKAVTLELTRAKVTEGKVEGVLGWWLKRRSKLSNEMIQLQLPNNSPRGWEGLSPLQFWSLDQLLEFNRRL